MPELSWRRVFPGEERQLAVLRQWLALLLPACPARGDLALVATELAANAVRHSASARPGGQFAVQVTWTTAFVRVAVTDAGAPSGLRVIDDPLSEHGRGLRVVEGMSARMGVSGDHRGRQVWADIPWGDAAAAEPASPQASEEAIQAGLADLASSFAGVPVWFGRATRQWWAVAGRGELVAAPSARDLAGLLSRVAEAPSERPASGGSAAAGGAGLALPVQRGSRPRPPGRVRSVA